MEEIRWFTFSGPEYRFVEVLNDNNSFDTFTCERLLFTFSSDRDGSCFNRVALYAKRVLRISYRENNG